jgi:hypothetical protein
VGIDARGHENAYRFIGDDRRPIDLVAEWTCAASGAIRGIFVTGLDDDIAIDDI